TFASSLARPVLELCCFEWSQNVPVEELMNMPVLELCCLEWSPFNIANGNLRKRVNTSSRIPSYSFY
ncbi:TPA: hypothetical protein ACJQI7_001267, partial [Streptococcus pyogenes]